MLSLSSRFDWIVSIGRPRVSFLPLAEAPYAQVCKMTIKEVVSPVPVPRPESMANEENQLPAYSPIEGSVVLVEEHPTEMANADAPAYRAVSPPVTSYPTAEQEKAQLRQSLGDANPDNPFVDTAAAYKTPMPAPDSDVRHAPATALARGLQVPTCSRFVSSGFPYPHVLANYRVTPADWARFTGEITSEAKMKANDWALAVGGGAGTFLVSGLIIGWWGVIPAFFVGRNIHRKREVHNLVEARNNGGLEEKLLKWNQDFFAPRGILIRLDLPGESRDIKTMDVHAGRGSGCHKRWQTGTSCLTGLVKEKKCAKLQQKIERKMEKKAQRACKKEGKATRRAAKKGRIVILPLNAQNSGASTPVTLPEIGSLSISEKIEGDLYASSVV